MSNRIIECRRHVELEATLRLALEGAVNYIDTLGGDSRKYRQVLAQPEQEPVAWGNFKEDGTLVGLSQHPEDQSNWTGRKPLYTTPPQRDSSATPLTWVGLTDKEYDEIWRMDLNNKDIMDKTIAKLKAKNERKEKNT